MAQTITRATVTKNDSAEGVERIWGPLPLESTAKFDAHAPVCSFVVLDADLCSMPTCWQWSRHTTTVRASVPARIRAHTSESSFEARRESSERQFSASEPRRELGSEARKEARTAHESGARTKPGRPVYTATTAGIYGYNYARMPYGWQEPIM